MEGVEETRARVFREHVKILTDRVHELLDGPEGTGQIDGPQETVRILLEVPKAFVLLAAWLEFVGEVRRGGSWGFFVVDGWNESDQKKRARRLVASMFDEMMHDQLHALCTGTHPFLQPPEANAQANKTLLLDDM